MRREISRLAVRSGPRNRSVSCLAVYSALGTAALTPADVCGPKVRLMRYRPLLIQIVADRIRFCWRSLGRGPDRERGKETLKTADPGQAWQHWTNQ